VERSARDAERSTRVSSVGNVDGTDVRLDLAVAVAVAGHDLEPQCLAGERSVKRHGKVRSDRLVAACEPAPDRGELDAAASGYAVLRSLRGGDHDRADGVARLLEAQIDSAQLLPGLRMRPAESQMRGLAHPRNRLHRPSGGDARPNRRFASTMSSELPNVCSASKVFIVAVSNPRRCSTA
jgi:hypothetical protein